MDFLFDNPLANMFGPYFVVLYTAFLVSTVIVFRISKSRLDKTAHLSLPPVPQNPDPFEIAFLRGGANELARAVIFSLNQKNLVKFINEEKFSRICPTNVGFEKRFIIKFFEYDIKTSQKRKHFAIWLRVGERNIIF